MLCVVLSWTVFWLHHHKVSMKYKMTNVVSLGVRPVCGSFRRDSYIHGTCIRYAFFSFRSKISSDYIMLSLTYIPENNSKSVAFMCECNFMYISFGCICYAVQIHTNMSSSAQPCLFKLVQTVIIWICICQQAIQCRLRSIDYGCSVCNCHMK